MAIHPGESVGDYRVLSLLGRGGMGEVWSAETPSTGKKVALKVLLAKAAMKPDLVRRFEREARIASSIRTCVNFWRHALRRTAPTCSCSNISRGSPWQTD